MAGKCWKKGQAATMVNLTSISDTHLAAWDVRRCSFESLLQEWRLRVALAYSSPAEETRIRRNIDVLGSEYVGVLCRYLREEGGAAFLCLVSALVS